MKDVLKKGMKLIFPKTNLPNDFKPKTLFSDPIRHATRFINELNALFLKLISNAIAGRIVFIGLRRFSLLNQSRDRLIG